MTELLNKLFRLDGKVALVPGGYGGLGEAVSRSLAAVSEKKAVALADALNADGYDTHGFGFDALSVKQINALVDQAVAHFGRLDILVNCVGLNREEKAGQITEENFDYVYSANLKSALFLAQAAANHMIRQGQGGKQVHLGSVRTLLGLRGRGYAAYCAAKGGLGTMCKQLAAEWASHKINVNVLAPTFVRTEQVAAMLSDPEFYSALTARIPLGRVAEPDEVMHAVLFFVSAASDFVTGQTLYLDGGITATQ
jgi:NAD(P)-dependent dehydrogenase (short-subunit alcohol dehydrogenase family)